MMSILYRNVKFVLFAKTSNAKTGKILTWVLAAGAEFLLPFLAQKLKQCVEMYREAYGPRSHLNLTLPL